MMIKLWYDEAWAQYLNWQAKDKKILKKINELLKDIERNRFRGLGKPEPLRHEYSGWWSRRIDDKNRLIYCIDGDIIRIMLCGSHYNDS
jgi:toxin YoeB